VLKVADVKKAMLVLKPAGTADSKSKPAERRSKASRK